MSNVLTRHRNFPPRGFAVLLGTAALALVLATPAHAQVAVDYNQLVGFGPAISSPDYSEMRQVQSPLAPGQALAGGLDEPVIIASKKPTDQPIALKPLAKWKMPTPAVPISLGQRTAILLRPPTDTKNDAKNVINALAHQSPTQNIQQAQLHLRPPAPKPPMPTMLASLPPAQLTATNVPPPMTMVAPAMAPAVMQVAQAISYAPPVQTQVMMAPSAPAPTTSVAMNVPPPQLAQSAAPAPTTMVAMAPPPQPVQTPTYAPVATTPMATPVSAQGGLRAEDVVALDLGAPKHDTPPDDNSAAAPATVKKSDVAPVAQPASVRTATTARPQFISPLTEGLPTDDQDTAKDTHEQAAALPPPVLQEPKHSAPQPESDTTKLAAAPAPSFVSSLGEVSSDASALPAAPPQKVAQAPSPKTSAPQFMSSLGDDAADASPPVPAKKVATATTPVPPPEVLKAPAAEKIAAAPAPEPAPTPPAATQTADAAPPPSTEKKTGYLTDPTPASSAAVVDEAKTDAPNAADIKWNKTVANSSVKEPADAAAVKVSHASADQAADTVADNLAQPAPPPKAAPQKLAEADVALPAPPAATPPVPTAQADNVDMAKLRAQIDQANQRVDAAQKEIDSLNAQQQTAEQKAKADADALNKAQAEALAKVQAETIAKAQAEADTKAKAEAEKIAQQRADEIVKQQTDVMAKAQADAISKVQADADAKLKAQADAMAKAQAEELAKIQAEADANKQRLAQLSAQQAEVEAKAKADASIQTAQQQASDAQRKQLEADARKQLEAAREKLAQDERAVPVKPVEHTEIAELPKVTEKAPIVRQAAISGNTLNDAVSDAAATSGIAQKTLLFRSGMSALPDDATPTIEQLAQDMKNNPSARVVINAYADTTTQAGSAARRLSLQRAVMVRDELNKMGVPISRVAVRAQTSDPGVTNPDRVDIVVQ